MTHFLDPSTIPDLLKPPSLTPSFATLQRMEVIGADLGWISVCCLACASDDVAASNHLARLLAIVKAAE